jgi:hypothetical protein
MMTDHPTLRPIPTPMPVDADVPPEAMLQCFRVLYQSHTTWQVDVWAASPAAAVRAVSIGMDHDAFDLIGVIDLATTR